MRKITTIVLGAAFLAGRMGIAMAAESADSDGGPAMRGHGGDYTKALNLLEANDYVKIGDLHRQGGDIVARAMHDGRQVTVVVDPGTRRITPQA
jgi:Spy/CpxP family protein refolding chaperone